MSDRAVSANVETGAAGENRIASLAAAALMLGALLGGCSAVSDSAKPGAMYGGAPAPAAEGASFPDLRDVPEARPEVATPAEQKQMADSLSADRDEARHADSLLRGGTEAPAPAPVVRTPTPMPTLENVPSNPALDKESYYKNAPTIPMPPRGGHRELSAVMKIETAAVKPASEPEVMTEDGAPAQAASSGPDTGPEVIPAPTRRIDVRPAPGGKS